MIRIILVLIMAFGIPAIRAADRPNFIFILSDDLAQDDVGVYGQKLIQTPRLDALAEEGTRYLQAYCRHHRVRPQPGILFHRAAFRPQPDPRKLLGGPRRLVPPAG